MMFSGNKHPLGQSDDGRDEDDSRPNQRRRHGSDNKSGSSYGEKKADSSSYGEKKADSSSYGKKMADLRYEMKQRSANSFRSILNRASLNAGTPQAAELLTLHIASYQAHEKNFTDVLYPSAESTGEVIAFGTDDSNQLGILVDPEEEKLSDYPPTLIPKTKLPSTNIKTVECGGLASFALTDEGTAYAWGVADEGQLGVGEVEADDSHKILKVKLDNIIQIAPGNTHSAFLDIDGKVFTTGQYYDSEFGKWRDANTLDELKLPPGERDLRPNMSPYQITLFTRKVIKLSAGINFTAALLEDGQTLLTWGLAFDGELARSRSMGAPIVEVDEFEGASYHSYDCRKPMLGHEVEKVDKEGKKSTDFVVEGQKLYHNFLVPKPVEWSDGKPTKRDIVDFTCGGMHLLVVARDNDSFHTRVYSSGSNNCGQLGQGDKKFCHSLTPIKALDKKLICKVAAGEATSLALNILGDNVWGWGSNLDGILGAFGDNGPSYVSVPCLISFPKSLNGERIVSISAGERTGFAITNQSNVFCWGSNVSGQTGIDCSILEFVTRPRKLDYMESVAAVNPGSTKGKILCVASGGQHSLLLVKRFK